MRTAAPAAAVVAALLGCGGEPEAPAAWPILQTFHFTAAGVELDSACRNEPHLAEWSHRDLATTEIRVDGGETDTCVLPVDPAREQLVLQAVTCLRTDGDPRRVDVSLTVHTGASGGTVELAFPGAPGDRVFEPVAQIERTFGAGLVVTHDVTAFTVGGTGRCQLAGYYLDRAAPALGAVRIQDHRRRRAP